MTNVIALLIGLAWAVVNCLRPLTFYSMIWWRPCTVLPLHRPQMPRTTHNFNRMSAMSMYYFFTVLLIILAFFPNATPRFISLHFTNFYSLCFWFWAFHVFITCVRSTDLYVFQFVFISFTSFISVICSV